MSKPKKYPPFVHSDQDRAAYEAAVKGKYQQYVTGPADLLAIREGCYFDLDAAQKVERFLRLLPHTQGQWAGQPFELQPWQRDRIVYPLYGWKRANGTRRFRTGLIYIPKKNGKSTLAAGLSLYHLLADGEYGAQVYNAAVDRSQVSNVMDEAKKMLRLSKHPAIAGLLKTKRVEILKGQHRVNYLHKGAFYQALSADADSAEGKNISALICDEIHAWKGRKLWDALGGGGAARRQPLFLAITTAGQDTQNFAYEEYQYAKGVLNGTNPNWEYFAFVAEASPTDDPGDPKTWAKANPGLGVSPGEEYLASRWRKAKDNPEDRSRFLQYHLNLYVQQSQSAIPLHVWDRGGEAFDPEELRGAECVGGLDLGAVSDLTVLSLLFPQPDGAYKLLAYCWCPENRSGDRDRGKVSYARWAEDGFILLTEGNTMDHGRVRADINKVCRKYRVRALAVDTMFQGKQLASELFNYDGLPVVDFRNNMGSMADPTRTFMELVLSGKIKHGGNPVLRWMAGNLVLKRDPNGNAMPSKEKSHQKIDGIVSTIMALGVRNDRSTARSHYETADLIVLG